MKKILFMPFLGAIFASLGVGTLTTHAETTTIDDGTNTGNITINGTLGADNKKPDANIPEGSDQWINVTVDTATIFYNTTTSTDIVSPTYNITNNSGRPVDVTVSSLTQTNEVAIKPISALDVKFTRGTTSTDTTAKVVSTPLITSGAINSFTSATPITLASSNGKLVSADEDGAYSTNATFNYTGNVTSKLNETITPTFTMTLTFAAKSWA